jgi:hypothetical protein
MAVLCGAIVDFDSIVDGYVCVVDVDSFLNEVSLKDVLVDISPKFALGTEALKGM